MKPDVVDYLKVIEEEKDIAEQLVPFDEIVAENAGTLSKGFVMIKGHSVLELYDIIKNNPNTHYKFCGHNYILNSTKEEFDRMTFSAVVKKSRKGTDFFRSEIIGSRISELFGVDCPYVIPLGTNKKIIASLDFLRYSQEMETFEEFTGAMFFRQSSCGAWVRKLLSKINEDKSFSEVTDAEKSGLIKEVIRHYFVRKFLLKDNDFNCGNLAVVKGIEPCPTLVSFDFEFCLGNSMVFDYSGGLPADFMEKNIKELATDYPKELSEVAKELKLSLEKIGHMQSIFDQFIDNKAESRFWSNNIIKHVNQIDSYTQKYINERTM